MSVYTKQVVAAVQATEFHSQTTYSWFGEKSLPLPAAARRALAPTAARDYILVQLQLQLYTDFYCQGGARPVGRRTVSPGVTGLTPFVEALSAANSGRGCWEDGWQVCEIDHGKVVVCKDGLKVWVCPTDCLVPSNSRIEPGTWLSLRCPKELLGISPGFYMALSDKSFLQREPGCLVRLYWNLTPHEAGRFMQISTDALNRAGLGFRMKVVNEPARFTRCDAAVLYIRKADYPAFCRILCNIYPDLSAGLRQGTPAFTKRLAAGLGVAENPVQAESFGEHRCRILAEGMIRAYEQGKRSLTERMQVVEDCFLEAGVSLDQPFLNTGSADDYDLEPRLQQGLQVSLARASSPHAAFVPERFLQTADGIGYRLSRAAIWHESRCNWIGAEPTEQRAMNGLYAPNLGALGPELYSGTSGVALFLSELHALTGDAATRRTALGAIEQALSRVDAVPPHVRLGLYSGWTGIALASAHIGAVLKEEQLCSHAAHLLTRCMFEEPDCREFDLISGHAGAIAALLALEAILDGAPLREWAVRLGDELLRVADRSGVGYSWQSPAFPHQRNLTGLSHGTAGVGYAFVELFRATGDLRYQRAAEAAFEYERHSFDADVRNWPDFREETRDGKRGRHLPSFVTYWCHGAPGIALSRLRAYQVLKDHTFRAESVTALRTTLDSTEKALRSGEGNFSLCHGLAGNAEVLLAGYEVLGDQWTDGPDLTQAVADFGIQTYALREAAWPCGTGVGETPGLMLGLAGIGYFYLRLHDRTVPSILLLGPRNC
jgi:hypothetical protein